MINPADPGSHAYRFTGAQDGAPPEHSQQVYDTKPMQCVDYLLAQAFCVWEGGRLETLEEWQLAVQVTPYPWSGDAAIAPLTIGAGYDWMGHFPWATDADHAMCPLPWPATSSIEYAVYRNSYEYPKLGAADTIVYLAAPGRTRGRGPSGHADLVGNVYEMTSTISTYNANPNSARMRWSGNGSWDATNSFAYAGGPLLGLLEKTSRAGLRCAFR